MPPWNDDDLDKMLRDYILANKTGWLVFSPSIDSAKWDAALRRGYDLWFLEGPFMRNSQISYRITDVGRIYAQLAQ